MKIFQSPSVLAFLSVMLFFAVLSGGQVRAETILYGAAHIGSDGPSTLYRIDPSSGTVTAASSDIGFERVGGMEFDPSTATLYATGERTDGSNRDVLITIDPTTGVGTEVGLTGVEFFRGVEEGAVITDISFRPSDGTLFAWNFPSLDRPAGFYGGLSTINLDTGAATLIAHTTGILADNGSALAFTPASVLLHGAGEDPGGFNCTVQGNCDDILHTLDTTTGAATKLTQLFFPPAPPGVVDTRDPRPNAMTFNPRTGTLFASVVYGFSGAGNNFLATIDTGTGNVTLVGRTIAGLDALAFADVDRHLLPKRSISNGWTSVSLPFGFEKPVVIAGPPTFEDKEPGVVRLRQISSTSFQARFQEWRYLDGKHAQEEIDFLVMEKGRSKLVDGSIWEAGTLKVGGNRNWKRKSFRKAFPGRPQLFLTVQTFNGKPPVAVRARGVTKSGFEAALFEEEKDLGTGHPEEKVGYIAVYSAMRNGTIPGGATYKLKRPSVNHRFSLVLGTEIKLEEEKSQDTERRHGKERVSVMRLGDGYFAQQVTDNERDTTALRRRPSP